MFTSCQRNANTLAVGVWEFETTFVSVMSLPALLAASLSTTNLSNENYSCLINTVSSLGSRHTQVYTQVPIFIHLLFLENIAVTLSMRQIQTRPDVFIIVLHDNDMHDFFHTSRSSHCIYLLSLEKATEEEVKMLIFTFWSHKLFDVTVYVNGTNYQSVLMECQKNTIIVKNRKCTSNLLNNSRLGRNHCPLKINWVTKEPYFIDRVPTNGMEYFLLQLVGHYMQKNIQWLKEEYKGQNVNGTWTGALGNIQDLAGGGFIMTEYINNEFMQTYPHHYDSYRWYAPIPNPKKFFDDFSILSFFVHVLFFIYICTYFSIMSKNDRLFSTPLLCALNVFRLGIGQPIRKTPKSTRMRILCITWVVFQMHVTVLYSGDLTQKLVTHSEPGDVQRDLAKIVCITANMPRPNLKEATIHNKCNLSEMAYNMTHYKTSTVLAGEEQMNFVIKRERLPIQKEEPRYLTRYNTFILPKKSKYYDVVNIILQRIFESGIYNKIRQHILFQYMKEEIQLPQNEVDLTLFYVVVLTGWCISSLVFVGEIIIYNFLGQIYGKSFKM